ncbi:MAG: hypothetical protein JXR84_18825 [Anaerolineae bacterium]|nr:hypothetical protein [Anaerolineae bacterium]
MKIWLKSVILIWLGVCLLSCVATAEPEAPPSPTSRPTWTPTCSPEAMPTAMPTATHTATATVTSTPAVRPSPTLSPIPEAQIDPDADFVSYADRPAWRAFLGWPDDCEEGFELLSRQPDDYGGIDIYPVDDNRYLIFVLCTLGPYWVEERVYWFENSTGLPTAQPIMVPELVQDDAPEQGVHEVNVLYGSFPIYLPETQTLTTLHAYRGVKDCGVFYKYHLEDARFVLDEARYRDCEELAETDFDVLNAYQWPLVYPPPLSAGPFRKVTAQLPPLGDWRVNLQALPDGSLRLMTSVGYATFRDGQWDTQLVDEGQTLVGVHADGRAWILDETGDTIYMRDAGGERVAADVGGWTPVSDSRALLGRGVVSDAQGKVWLATEQDVRIFDGEQWTIYTREAMGMPPAEWEDLLPGLALTYVESQQQMWVRSCDWGGPGPFGGGGARWFDGQAWHGDDSPVADGCVTAIVAGAEGNVWVGLDHGLVYRFGQTSGAWREFPLPEPDEYRRGYPAALSLGPDGTPWLLSALCGGASCDATRALYHLRDDVWIEVAGLRDYPEGLIYQGPTLPVLFDEAGTPWFLFGMMAFRIVDDRLEQPPAAELNVWDATVDAAGQIWVVANAKDDSPALWILEVEK